MACKQVQLSIDVKVDLVSVVSIESTPSQLAPIQSSVSGTVLIDLDANLASAIGWIELDYAFRDFLLSGSAQGTAQSHRIACAERTQKGFYIRGRRGSPKPSIAISRSLFAQTLSKAWCASHRLSRIGYPSERRVIVQNRQTATS